MHAQGSYTLTHTHGKKRRLKLSIFVFAVSRALHHLLSPSPFLATAVFDLFCSPLLATSFLTVLADRPNFIRSFFFKTTFRTPTHVMAINCRGNRRPHKEHMPAPAAAAEEDERESKAFFSLLFTSPEAPEEKKTDRKNPLRTTHIHTQGGRGERGKKTKKKHRPRCILARRCTHTRLHASSERGNVSKKEGANKVRATMASLYSGCSSLPPFYMYERRGRCERGPSQSFFCVLPSAERGGERGRRKMPVGEKHVYNSLLTTHPVFLLSRLTSALGVFLPWLFVVVFLCFAGTSMAESFHRLKKRELK